MLVEGYNLFPGSVMLGISANGFDGEEYVDEEGNNRSIELFLVFFALHIGWRSE